MAEVDPLNKRSDEQITDDFVKILRIVNPLWLRLFPDDSTLTLHVRDTLDELEQLARDSGHAGTGCMWVEYDAEAGSFEWKVTVATRFDEKDDGS